MAGPRGSGAAEQHEQLTFQASPLSAWRRGGQGVRQRGRCPSSAQPNSRGVSFESVPTRSVLNSPAATHMPFWSVNPYIGCEFGCTYCYARDTHRWTMERTAGATPLSAAERLRG